jgi:hypothetical protein
MSEAKGEGAGQERAAMSEGERLGRFDLHVHTTMSDGGLPLDEVIEVARQRGVVIGISDHVSGRNPGPFVSDDAKRRSFVRPSSAGLIPSRRRWREATATGSIT